MEKSLLIIDLGRLFDLGSWLCTNKMPQWVKCMARVWQEYG